MAHNRLETFELAPQEPGYCGPEEWDITSAVKIVEDASAPAEDVSTTYESGKWYFTPMFIVFAGVTALALVQAALAVHATFAASPVLGAFYAAIAVLIVCTLISVMIKEVRLLLRLKKAETLRAKAAEAVKEEDKSEVVRICRSLAVNTRKGADAAYDVWLAEKDSLGTAKEVFIRYSDLVLAKADDEAAKIISGHSLNTAALVAICPLALGDMLLVLMNSRRMLDKIADCYGIRLGFASRIKLCRRILQNMALVGGADMLLGGIGTGVVEIFARKVGEGLLAGFFSARLGIGAAHICRPLPMPDGGKKLDYADICGQIKNSMPLVPQRK